MIPSIHHPRQRFWSVVLAAVAAAGITLGVGYVRTPTPAWHEQAPSGVLASSVSMPSEISVATFNIHSGIGSDDKFDLARTARTLEGMDIVGMNEVRGALTGPDQAKELAALTNLKGVFLPTERQFWHEAFGNGLLCRYPVTELSRIPLPAPAAGSRRNVTVSTVDGRLRVVLTHITRSKDMDLQLREVSKLFLEQPEPAILMGDFNTRSDHPVLQELLGRPGVQNPLDMIHPDLSGSHIDWILVRGMKVLDAGTRDIGASDHPMVWAKLAFITPATEPSPR